MNKIILVAGGAGFIGSNLCEALIKRGDHVFCVDNFMTGRKANIKDLLNSNKFDLFEGDITDNRLFCTLPPKLDIIINLACIASPKVYYRHPIQTMLTSVIGTKNLLDLANRTGAIMIQASTSEVYGDPDVDLLSENYNGNVNCIGPRACYDEGKRSAETLCSDYSRIYGTKVRIIRIFNTYGPKMAREDGRAIPEFIYKALKNEDIIIFGTGKQTRSFMYITDLINALLILCDKDNIFLGPLNIGNPNEEYSISELAAIIKGLTSSKSMIVNKDKMLDDPRKRRPSIGLAIESLNWKPTVSLESGLIKTIKFFRAYV